MINVSWSDAQYYARWLSARSGLHCRLPSEREWELAARAGTDTAFWWGDAPHANLANCRDCGPKPIYGSLPAGSFPANPWGLVDMNGNVWEWTQDCWSADRAGPIDRDLQSCPQRVIKGGSRYYYSANARWNARATRANVLLITAGMGIVGGIGFMVFGQVDGNTAVGGGIISVVTLLAGKFATAFDFEFGGSADSEQTRTLLVQAPPIIGK